MAYRARGGDDQLRLARPLRFGTCSAVRCHVGASPYRGVLAYMTFPKEHRAKLHSTNPIERLNGEIKRRTDVVGLGGKMWVHPRCLCRLTPG